MRRFFCLFAFLSLGGFVFSQKIDDNSVLLIVGSDTTTRGDFLKTYSQNQVAGRPAKPSRQDLENYLDLYVNYRMKVAAAKDACYDTNTALRDELMIYRKQLSKPYVMDKDLQEALEQETYRNMQYDVFARHILVSLPLYPSPADTLAAWKKINEARERIMRGDDFSEVAFEYSDDIRRNRKGEKVRTGKEGEIGYFTALSMVYPIEHAVYSMKVGELSGPIRSRYGYHVVQLLDKKPALGKVTFAHILAVTNPADSTGGTETRAKARIDSAYAALQSGQSFGEVAKRFSDDRYSAEKGGFVGSFAVNRMIPEVIAQFYGLEKDQYSKPFPNRFGWQIVYLMDKEGVPSEGDALEQIRYGIEKDMERSSIPFKAFLDRKLEASAWTWDKKALADVKAYYQTLPSLKMIPKDSSENPGFFSRTILIFENQNFTIWEFLQTADGLTTNVKQVNDFVNWFKAMQDEFLHSAALRHELSLLESKHPDFAKLMGEYRDGVYLFDINNRKVWAKALYDTAGLQTFFQNNRDRYVCPEKAVAVVISYDVTRVETKDMAKFAKKVFKQGLGAGQIQVLADGKFGKKTVQVDSAAFASGENVFLDNMPWKPGLSGDVLSGTTRKAFVILDKVEPGRPYRLDEVRGTVISDYQAYLEQEWLKELRAKYKVDINEDVFESLFR